MSAARDNDAARREIVDALQKLLAERQSHVLRLEALAKEEAKVRRRLEALDDEQHILIERLKALVGPPGASEEAPNGARRRSAGGPGSGRRVRRRPSGVGQRRRKG